MRRTLRATEQNQTFSVKTQKLLPFRTSLFLFLLGDKERNTSAIVPRACKGRGGANGMVDRRRFMETCTGLGLGSTLLPRVLWAQTQAKGAVKITKEMIEAAAAIADVAISDEYRQMMLDNLNEQQKGYEAIYALHILNSVEPALLFDPIVNDTKYETERKPERISAAPSITAPKNVEDLAFASVRELAELVRTKKVSSSALTEMSLQRLKRYDATLKFTVTLTDERARA